MRYLFCGRSGVEIEAGNGAASRFILVDSISRLLSPPWKKSGSEFASCASSPLIADVLTYLRRTYDHSCARNQISRLSSSTVPKTRRRKSQRTRRRSVSTRFFLKLSFLFFLQQLHRHDNVRSGINLSKRRSQRRDSFFTVRWYSRARRNEERESEADVCCVHEQGLHERSTRVAAASWPTITELTPTVALRRLFTCYE